MNNNNLKEDTLAQLASRGGIYYNVRGGTRQEVLANLINGLQVCAQKDELFQAVMEREALISTGIEKGIALPHPRTPIHGDNKDPFVAIAFPLEVPADWPTPDNSRVHTVFLIVSKSPKQHLDVMSRISFLCKQDKFNQLVLTRAPKEKIIAAIKEAESGW